MGVSWRAASTAEGQGTRERGSKGAMKEQRKLRMGMVGGGPGAFIGPVHRIAAELDGKIELVAGAFSQSAEGSKAAGEAYRIAPSRAYSNFKEMIECERQNIEG